MEELRNKNHIKNTENKQQNGKSKSLLICNYLNVNGLNFPIKRKKLA